MLLLGACTSSAWRVVPGVRSAAPRREKQLPRVVSVKGYVFQNWFAPFFNAKNASLAFALAYVAFWLALMWLLYRRKIFIKI